jgi:hypothetical protein
MRSYPSISVEYVRVRLYLDEELDDQQPKLAIIGPGIEEPDTGDWVAADWLSDDDTVVSASGTTWHTRDVGILIGPGQLELDNGQYRVWWQMDLGNQQQPARPVGTIQIT